MVILHYNDHEITDKYIDDLKKLEWGLLRYHFIIVGNGSPDGSGKHLYDTYQGADDVTVILNSENMGFARGNNLGIKYAVKHFDPELVIISNNDIYIEDIAFPQKLWNIYQDRPAAVIGPDIYSLSKRIHQSPIRERYLSADQLKKQIKHIDRILKKLRIIKFFHLYDLISKVKRKLGKKPGTEGYAYDKEQEDVVLQGAFFVLSRHYMEKYPDGLFEGTFLYMEEDILSYHCSKKQLMTLYTPDLKVIHYDGCSTKKIHRDRCSKYMFELNETKRSCSIMLDYMRSADIDGGSDSGYI